MKRRTDHFASYKDPAAKVFFIDDDPEHIYRELSQEYLIHYHHFISSGLADELKKKKWLVAFEESISDNKTLKAKKIPFVLFPYEWTFSQWKEAAMLTIKVQHLALKHGMTLKDATPFNIVFDGSTPVFIDISSFEIYKEGQPWAAYKQFSENFYLPLLLYKYFDSISNNIYLENSSGIPLYKGLPLLPLRAHLNFNTIFYLSLPDKLREQSSRGNAPKKSLKGFSAKKMLQFTDQLFSNIDRIKQSKKTSKWNEYYSEGNIDAFYVEEKRAVIKKWFAENFKDKVLIDFGCNTGNFSILLSEDVKYIIAFDEDARSVDELYQHCRKNKIPDIFSFTANLSSPTPSTGWNNEERPSLFERLKGDVGIALALIHHLAITNHITFEMMAKTFASMAGELFIEFVPVEDPKVQLLLNGREEIFSWYNWDGFVYAFEKHFHLIKSHHFQNKRVLVHFTKKQDEQ